MEKLSVEIIGKILSHLGAARDVVLASCTCREWREAWRNHLYTLTFNSNDWPVYDALSKSRLEVIITRTIFQTNALQCLSIITNNVFSPAPVIAWLIHSRETLLQLHYNVKTPDLHILDFCGLQKLELLDLADIAITGVESGFQKFPCLRSLSLSYLTMSDSELSCLVAGCPKIEVLYLVALNLVTPNPEDVLRLCSDSLKEIHVEAIQLSGMILEAVSLEKLHIKHCDFGIFQLLSKGSLRVFQIYRVRIYHLDIGDNAENLEIVEISRFDTVWSNFHRMLVKLSKVRRLSLCSVVFEEEDEDEDDVMDIEATSACFPQLTHLSLTYELREFLQYGLLCNIQFENLVVLELGWKVITDLFSQWVSELLERCPNLRKLVIKGDVSGTRTHEECQILADFTSFMFRLMKKYSHIDVQFNYV